MTLVGHVYGYRVKIFREAPGTRHVSVIDCFTYEGHFVTIIFTLREDLMNFISPLYRDDYPEYGDIYDSIIYEQPDKFIWYLDLLRNEKVQINLNTDNPNRNVLMTELAAGGWGHFDW
jgi:hypothetical protein